MASAIEPAGAPRVTPLRMAAAPRRADGIYRPFFKAGILIVLTLGATWGAYLLVRIGLGGSFTAAGLHDVNAHGHAQIFGWVGLFVMGFAYQAFPRFKQTALAAPALARASLGLMVTGLLAHALLHPFAAGVPALMVAAGVASAVEVAAVLIFVGVLVATWRRAGKPLAVYEWYIVSALAWFVIQAIYESVYLAATLAATGPDLIDLVKTWQAPLRDLQVHGFALLMIFGVSLRLLPTMYLLRVPSSRRAAWVLAALNVAVAAEAAGLVLRRIAGEEWTALWYAAVLLLTAPSACLVRDMRLFAPAGYSDRSLKFIRAAYVWLFVSLAMLVLLPAYQFGLLGHFSHAYYGAVRHAITVGFVSLMIVGVASRVAAVHGGYDVHRLCPLWAPFLLINAGCTLRVVSQTLTDMTSPAFPVAAVSGLLEVAGLALWGLHMWKLMARPSAGAGCGCCGTAHG
jgi:hypothetical protein